MVILKSDLANKSNAKGFHSTVITKQSLID